MGAAAGMALQWRPALKQGARPSYLYNDQTLGMGCHQEGVLTLGKMTLFSQEQFQARASALSCQQPTFWQLEQSIFQS